ncbi:MAG: flagellar hook-length control protein FliK [Deltaproteobacteria bacterium]|nr:flagellar hook-length control protein FliK [Deltaproteobacteria bacterium]
MMNALPVLTDAPSLAGPGVMPDSHGPSGDSSLLGRSGGFQDIMAKINAVSRSGNSSKQSDIGPASAQGTSTITNGVDPSSGPAKTAQMPDERQLQQLAVLVQQLPQDVQQMLAHVVNQGDLKQLQLVLQRLQINNTFSNDMPEEAAPAVETQAADAEDVQAGPLDMQEAQKLALAIWLMSFAGPLAQAASPGRSSVLGLNTGAQAASVNWCKAVSQDNSMDSKAAVSAGPATSFQPSPMVAADSSGPAVAPDAVAPASSGSDSVLSSSSSSLEGLFPPGLLESFRASVSQRDSGELRSVLELLVQPSVSAGVGPAVAPDAVVSASSGSDSVLSSSSSSLEGLFPPGLLESFRASVSQGDSRDLRSVLELLMQPPVSAGISADSNQIKTADSLELPVNKAIVGAVDTAAGDDSDAQIQGEPLALPVPGVNQEKSAHIRGKQAVFADLKESLKDLSQAPAENKDVRQGQVEPFAFSQGGTSGNESSRPFEQDIEDMPSNNSPDLQQITGGQRMESRETVVVRRNVPVHAVTREAESIITKGMEQGQTLPRRVVLYLDPPELGRVRVNMVLDSGNQLSVNFVAEHASVRTVLEGHMEQLRGQLVQKGMEVSTLRVEAGGFADFASLDQGFQQNTPQERWASFKGDWPGMFSAKNVDEEETRQAAPIFKSNANGRLHLII